MTKAIVSQDAYQSNQGEPLGDATDALRDLLAAALNGLMQQEVATQVGAAAYQRTDGRQGYRNGTRERRFDTRMGSLSVHVPRIRKASTLRRFSITGSAAKQHS